MAHPPEPDDLDKRIARDRKRMDTARADLLAGIREALDLKRSPSRIGRYARWSRDYIAKIQIGRAHV